MAAGGGGVAISGKGSEPFQLGFSPSTELRSRWLAIRAICAGATTFDGGGRAGEAGDHEPRMPVESPLGKLRSMPRLLSVHPVVEVGDMSLSIGWYCEAMGFEVTFDDGHE